jgi:hypothetical protein
VAGLSGLSGLTANKSEVEITDAASCGDTTTGGGTMYEKVKYNGTTWDVVACGPSGSPPSGVAEDLLSTQTLASAAASITFSSISSSYTDLIVRCSGRGDAAATTVHADLTVNGDTAANYNYQSLYAAGGTVTGAFYSSQTSLAFSQFPAASAPANYEGNLTVEIPQYAGTSFTKQLIAKNLFLSALSTGNVFILWESGWWTGTAAISSLTVTASSGNFVAGTICSLYGRN